jgi:radical SAM superfamily enzyme YgiQ (UPF0313 family)
MGFFSNLIKKAGKFIASVFRDVEKPVKETEKTVKETVEEVEDIGLKAFREFQEFIEKPIEKIEEVIEEAEEVEEEIQWFKKIVKTGASDKRTKRSDTWENFYAITWEDNDYDRTDDLLDWLQMEFPNKSFHASGYESSQVEEIDEFPEVTFPEIIGGTE